MINKLQILLILASQAVAPISFSQEDTPVEIMVIGRQPGPPMWRVLNGDNVLWIFPHLDLVPKDMIWESEKVETVIAESQQALSMPEIDVSISKLVMLNPINIFRGIRLGNRMSRNPDKATLEEVVPPELYARYAALKSEYFPRNKGIEKQRPFFAGNQMINIIQKESGLVSGADVSRKIRRLVRRNRDIEKTTIEIDRMIEGGFGVIAERMENLMASLSTEQELICFEDQIKRMESDIEEAKYRANAWARGYIDEFRFVSLPGSNDDDCTNLILESSESEMIEELSTQMDNDWLDVAETALETNQSTFAVLNITELLREGGLIDQLKTRGYEVVEP